MKRFIGSIPSKITAVITLTLITFLSFSEYSGFLESLGSKKSSAAGSYVAPLDWCKFTNIWPGSHFLFDRSDHLHAGYDMSHKVGIYPPVYAVADGTITSTNVGTSGSSLWMKDALGYNFFYQHLKSIRSGVVTGKKVVKGQIIGYTGGYNAKANGDHLHFGVTKGSRVATLPYGSKASSVTLSDIGITTRVVNYNGAAVYDPYPFIQKWKSNSWTQCGEPNLAPIIDSGSLSHSFVAWTGYNYTVKLKVKASDPNTNQTPGVIFRMRPYRDCTKDWDSTWITYPDANGYYTYNFTNLNQGVTYEFSAKARDGAYLYSSGSQFCTQTDGSISTGWATAKSFTYNQTQF